MAELRAAPTVVGQVGVALASQIALVLVSDAVGATDIAIVGRASGRAALAGTVVGDSHVAAAGETGASVGVSVGAADRTEGSGAGTRIAASARAGARAAGADGSSA